MSLAPVSMDRQPSPRLTVNLGSNNPFRNRTDSPGSPSLASPDIRPARPVSTNPFLDEFDSFSPQSAPTGAMASPVKSPVDSGLTGHAAELFENLSLEQSKPPGRRPPSAPRAENVPPRDRRPPPPPPARPRQASGDDGRRRRQPKLEKPLIDVFADQDAGPSKPQSSRRPRRNSDSSLMERPSRNLDDDDKRRRERRREREARQKGGKSSGGKSSRSKKQHLDIIDKLDVTGIFGSGHFHHDGPFDACNPHRNRKGQRTAPMQAFPKDSRNMALGGSGPVNTNIDLNQFHGRGAEGYSDFAVSGAHSAAKKTAGVSFDPSSKLEPIHGEASMGLGTSTFLEGAPASRAAIQRRQSDNETQNIQSGGLQRKKSLAQKIRGINSRRGGGGDGGNGGGHRVTSPEAVSEDDSTLRPAGRSTSAKRPVSRNPFFQDYDDAYDQKGTRIQEANGDEVSRPRSVSSPKSVPSLERRVTTDGIDTVEGEETKPTGGGGFMNRMKSLRRPKPERRPIVPSKTDV